jgi:hypothetical protein
MLVPKTEQELQISRTVAAGTVIGWGIGRAILRNTPYEDRDDGREAAAALARRLGESPQRVFGVEYSFGIISDAPLFPEQIEGNAHQNQRQTQPRFSR